MKRSIYIVTILLILGLSGCIGTKIYLGGEGKKDIKEDTPMSRAIDPTAIPAGGTWGSIRTILNANFDDIDLAIDTLDNGLADAVDSISAHRTAINLRLLKSDTTSMLANYTRNGELNSALAAKVNVSDTATMLSPYALTSELRDAGAGDVIGLDTIAEYRVVLWAGQDTLTGSPGLTYNYSGGGALSVYGSVNLNGSINFFGSSTSGQGIMAGRSTRASAILNQTASPVTPNILIDRSYSETGIGGVRDTAIGFITNNVMRFSSHDNRNESYVLLKTPATTSASAGFRLPHGTAPTSPINGDVWTTTVGIFTQINGSTDTLATQEYARQYGGTGTVTISDVQNEIADSLNVLRPLVVMLADTTGTSSGSYVSGYTFQTGMSNKLMIADSLTAYVTPSQLSDSLATIEWGGVTLETVRGEISDSLDARIGAGIELSDVAVMIADSTGNAPGNYVTHKALVDSINANLGGVAGITLNSGTITLTGDGGTADDITFYTNGDGSYNLPTGGGNLTIMSEVQGWINDSLDVFRPLYLEVADTASMLSHYAKLSDLSEGGVSLAAVQEEIADSLNAIRSASIPGIALADSTGYAPGNYVTHTQLDAFSGGSFDTTYLHYRIDSLITVVENQATEIENLWNAIETLGDFDLTAPAFLSAEIGTFADDTLVVLMDTTDVRQDSVPPLTAFTLWAGAIEHGIASVDIGHDTLYIALDSAGVYGATYTLDYTRGTPALQDSTGNKTASWTGRSVTNNMPEPEAGVPTFLTSDGYTWSWLEANAAYLTLNGTQITAVNDKGSGNHDWTGNGTPGAQWDAVNEEIDFAYGSSANLELATSPSSLPVTVYMVVRITDWSDGRALMYFTVPTARISQAGGTNQLLLYAGQYNLFADYTNGEYAVITATLNGATSSIQWNDDTPVTGNAGTNGISGIYLGYDQDNANFSTKEVIVRSTSDSAQNKTDVKAYLYSKYSITP